MQRFNILVVVDQYLIYMNNILSFYQENQHCLGEEDRFIIELRGHILITLLPTDGPRSLLLVAYSVVVNLVVVNGKKLLIRVAWNFTFVLL